MKVLITVLCLLNISQGHAMIQQFKMYDVPNPHVNPLCDIHSLLVLQEKGTTAIAKVSSRVEGVCEIFIPANQRIFQMRIWTDDCGSRIYKSRNLVIFDNRDRHCQDLVGSALIMHERVSEGEERIYYSQGFL